MKILITRNYSGLGSRVTVIQVTVRAVKKLLKLLFTFIAGFPLKFLFNISTDDLAVHLKRNLHFFDAFSLLALPAQPAAGKVNLLGDK